MKMLNKNEYVSHYKKTTGCLLARSKWNYGALVEKIALIVDDNPLHRTLLTNFLMVKGYKTDEAANGIEALAKLEHNSYNIILMDLLMPGMNGYETVKNIRARNITTPVIAQSSLSLKQDRDRCIESGCTDFVPKPINLKELWDVVERYGDLEHEQTSNSGKYSKVINEPIGLSANNTVLLVEEDDERALHNKQILTNLGLDVSRVSNGNEAIEAFNNDRARTDIIISNIFTSGIDGLGLTTIIKRKYPDTMIFIYTEEEDRDTMQLAVNIGADGVLTRDTFDTMIGSSIETALYQSLIKKALSNDKATAEQVRQSQDRLARYGYFECPHIDAASSMFMDAGGDLVLVRRFNLAGRYGVLLADVSGHDVRSSYISAIFLGIITSIWDSVQTPLDLLKLLNKELLKLKASQYHVCATAILWDQLRGTVEIASAGNPGALIINTSGKTAVTTKETLGGGMCLGMLERDDLYYNETVSLQEDDYLLLFSDGIHSESLTAIAHEKIADYKGKSISGFSNSIISSLEKDTVIDDDMILVTLQGQPKALPGIHYHVSSTYDEVNRATDWLSSQLDDIAITTNKDKDVLLLAVRETLLNAVEHGNKNTPYAFIDIELIPTKEHLKVNISDQGRGYNFKEMLEEKHKTDGMQVGKRGLQLIDAFSDSIEINGGTVSLYFNNETMDSNGGFK